MISQKTSFVGKFAGTAEDLINQFIRVNPSKADRAKRLAPLYIKYGNLFTLRADLAWAQMEHETGYLNFTGDVKPEQNNFVGIGATGGVPGNSFRTEEHGVIAHFAHLAWYYFPDHVNVYCSKKFDPRHFGDSHYNYNWDTSIERLNGSWAVPGKTYAQSIARIANQIFGSTTMASRAGEFANKILDAIHIRTEKNWQYIAIHHSVSDQFKTNMAQIRQWHLARNFIMEGYNFGIDGNGLIEVGRPLTMSGAHVGPKWNSKAIGICLYGDFRYVKPTQKQLNSAYILCQQLMDTYSIPVDNVKGHYDFMATACPVIDMGQFRKDLKEFISKEG